MENKPKSFVVLAWKYDKKAYKAVETEGMGIDVVCYDIFESNHKHYFGNEKIIMSVAHRSNLCSFAKQFEIMDDDTRVRVPEILTIDKF